VANNHQVSNGEFYSISAGQTDIGDNVLSGGFMAIQNGGIAIATFIQSGGQVFDVGVASASLILNGGLQTVFAQPGFIGIA
jgi:autotransporter passenger strand-loop-strand repeat protein